MGTSDILKGWQNEALNVLDDKPDPGDKFEVLAHMVRTATNALDPIRAKDNADISRITQEAAHRPAEAGFPIVFDDRGGNVKSLEMLSVGLDQMLFPDDKFLKGQVRCHIAHGITVPDYVVKRDYEEIELFSSRVIQLAHVIHKYFGTECIDLVLGLLGIWLRENYPDKELTKARIESFDPEDKRLLVEYLLGQCGPFPEEEDGLVIRWALGSKFSHKITKEAATPEQQMRLLKEIFDSNERFRRKLLRALRGLQLTSDRLTVSAVERWGWKTVAEVDEVSDFEWWSFMRDSHEKLKARLAKDEPFREIMSSTPEKRGRFDLRERRIAAFFASNPNPPSAEDLHKLKDVIGCDRLREELEKLDREHNPRGYEEKQREILARVSGAVSRYVIEQSKDEEDAEPAWQRGTPMRFRETKSASCFTGPWLIAVMLMEAGIQYNDLIYAHVNQAHDKQIGGHGGLVMKTMLRHAVFIDHGYNFSCRDLPAGLASTREDAELLGLMLNGKIDEAVTVQFKHHSSDRIHRHMQFMPLNEGFAGGHLYHVGLRFLNENDLDKAEYAFELALSFNREDPDVLYHLGLVALGREDVEKAEAYFEDALGVFPDHLFSEFGLGICLARRGHFDTAKHHFRVVAESSCTVWENEDLKEKAGVYAELTDTDLQNAVSGVL